MLTYLVPPEDVHVLHNIGPEEVSIKYRRCSPIYHDSSIGTCSQVNGNTYPHPILCLAPKIATVRSAPRLRSSRAPLRGMKVLELLPNIVMSRVPTHHNIVFRIPVGGYPGKRNS